MTFDCECHWCGKPLIRKYQSRTVSVHFCDNVCKAEYQRTAKPVSREWLVEHYIEKRMDTTQIAHIVKRDPKSVWNWLKDFGIPTRGRGYACNHLFPKGHKLWVGKHHTAASREKMSVIAKAQGRVPYDPAVGSYMKGRRGARSTNWKGGITPERQALYSSREWGDAVKEVWRRDNATCQNCGLQKRHARSLDFDIHHIVGFENRELRTQPDNLVLLCEPCHYWVHSKRNTERKFIKPCQ